MAYTVTKIADRVNSPLYKEFFCDTVADLANLPTNKDLGKPYSEVDRDKVCATGSIALVASTSDVYALNSLGEWVKL